MGIYWLELVWITICNIRVFFWFSCFFFMAPIIYIYIYHIYINGILIGIYKKLGFWWFLAIEITYLHSTKTHQAFFSRWKLGTDPQVGCVDL
jgi:hypothetical protein